MKRLVLSLSILFVGMSLWAQKPLASSSLNQIAVPVDRTMKSFTGAEKITEASVPQSQNILYRGSGNIGETTYDLQTNATAQNRIVNLGDETLAASWTKGENNFSTGWPNRGSGFNVSVNSTWGPNPTGRVEANDRSGWAGLAVTGDQSAVIICHIANPSGGYFIHMNKRGLTDLVWTESNIPHTSPFGALWPRVAAGGPDGNTIHAIGVATPTGFDGVEINGVDGQLLYSRSTDGGDTWDLVDVVIPGLDSTKHVTFPNDAYKIEASGNRVAIVVFNDWSDTQLAISEDNGDTWTTRTIVKCPLKKYVINSGVDTTLIPDYPDAPTTTAIYGTDGTGDVKIDADGKIHVVYGRMYLADDDLTDAGWTYYPYTDGIAYWNEDMDDNTYEVAASTPDLNGNDTLDITNWGGDYFSAISSQPSLGFDDEGNIFLVYSAVNELLVANANSKNYRHVYMVYSKDGGTTWDEEPPLDLTEQDEDLLEFIEGGAEFSYPQIAKKVDHKMHVIMQADGEPGVYVLSTTGGSTDDTQGLTPNLIWYLGIDNILSSTNEEAIEALKYEVFPNPASEQVFVKLALNESSNVGFELLNTIGQTVWSQQKTNVDGNFYMVVPVANIAPGTYFAVVNVNGERATKTIIID
jgi:hypothetical protein